MYMYIKLQIKENHRCIYLIFPIVMATDVIYPIVMAMGYIRDISRWESDISHCGNMAGYITITFLFGNSNYN